jgi:adenine deaminase
VTHPDETLEERIQRKLAKKQRAIRVARGDEKADLVIKNAVYLNVFSNEFCTGDIAVSDGLIAGVDKYSGIDEIDATRRIVCPGFIDAHIHLESSLVMPGEFAKAATRRGTTTVVTDPHEIANVMGADGIDFMLEASEKLPVDVHFMIPSCVPATLQDESGAVLDWKDIDRFYSHPRVFGLAEMMDYPSVVSGSAPAIRKILGSQAHHKKIDGHAPGLTGKELNAYITAGVYSDHECSTYEDALEKLRKGQFIMIREGTAARNLTALMPLFTPQYASRLMFATDDKLPGDLIASGHIDHIAWSAIRMGADPILVLKAASHNAARYFLMNNKGAVAPGYLADFAIADNVRDLNVLMTIKKGKVVYDGQTAALSLPTVSEGLLAKARDTFRIRPLTPADISKPGPLGLIGMRKNDIATDNLGFAEAMDTERDILKICVAERHRGTGHIGKGYLRGYGLKHGAVATSISHDSHNIIAVGASDADIAYAINHVAAIRGGIALINQGRVLAELPLPYAGLLSDKPVEETANALEDLIQKAHALGVPEGIDPVMSLSFMALSVIPALRVTTRGVLNVDTQTYV